MKEFWRLGTVCSLMVLGGFLMGKESVPMSYCENPEMQEVDEGVTFRLKQLTGDVIFLSLEGEGRIIIDNHTVFENPGDHSFSLASIPNKEDLLLRESAYLGNEKTKKFYNSNTYPARGTEVRYRRFFNSAEEAKKAGFIPSKNLK